eukprot:m.325630 g.325630  ORF g.325630 m.325630 type:complete len:112 (+) comp16547_c0_seq24:226-561(+)
MSNWKGRVLFCKPGDFFMNTSYDSSIPLHKSTMTKARQKSTAARALVSQPWSRTRNHYLKWKPMQEIIQTVLLIGERFRRKPIEISHKCLRLRALPVEIWEMILECVLIGF